MSLSLAFDRSIDQQVQTQRSRSQPPVLGPKRRLFIGQTLALCGGSKAKAGMGSLEQMNTTTSCDGCILPKRLGHRLDKLTHLIEGIALCCFIQINGGIGAARKAQCPLPRMSFHQGCWLPGRSSFGQHESCHIARSRDHNGAKRKAYNTELNTLPIHPCHTGAEDKPAHKTGSPQAKKLSSPRLLNQAVRYVRMCKPPSRRPSRCFPPFDVRPAAPAAPAFPSDFRIHPCINSRYSRQREVHTSLLTVAFLSVSWRHVC